jgi:hypothetical protein
VSSVISGDSLHASGALDAALLLRRQAPELLERLYEAAPAGRERADLAAGWLDALESQLGNGDSRERPAAWAALAASAAGREAAERAATNLCRVAVAWLSEAGAGGQLSPAALAAGATSAASLTGEILSILATRQAPGQSPLSPGRQRQRQRLMELLLTGSFDDERPLRRMAVATGMRLQPAFRVLAVEGIAPGDVDAVLDPHRTLSGPDGDGVFVVLLTGAEDEAQPGPGAAPVIDLLERHPEARCGVGGAARTLAQVGRSHMEAVEALNFARLQGAAGLHLFADVALFAAIRQHPHDVELYVDSVLGPAERHPSYRRLDLANVLMHYLETSSLEKTARRLRLHKQTVAYRLRRAGELLRVDMSHQADRFRVYLALLLRKSSA